MSRLHALEPSERTRRFVQAQQAAHVLTKRGDISGVAVTWVDNSGITRVKTVPLARLAHAAAWGIGASPVFDTFLFDDSSVLGEYSGGPVGDLRLHPDVDRLVALAAQPGWAWAPADRHDQDGAVHPLDSRALARNETARLAADGFSVLAAFEIEWCVSVGGGDEFTAACSGPAYGMARLVELSDYAREVLDALTAQGIAVDQLHPEYAAGQYEVSVAAEDPVAAADTFVLARETIRAVSVRHGLRATFSPKVLAGGVGNGAHVHLSLWRDGENVMAGGEGRFGLTKAGEGFAGGILEHLPALLALGSPSVASYLRLIPSHWAGAYACWGLENREAALRFVTGPVGDRARAANLEVKCFDASANPYLLMAGLLAAASAGVASGTTLPEPVDVDPVRLDAEAAARSGVKPLPSTLAAAVEAFEADLVLEASFGTALIDTIATVRRGEIAVLDGASAEEIVARTRWRH